MKTFMGYKRADGRVGIRNKVLILPCSMCASDTTRMVSQKVEGTTTFNLQTGCSQVGSDLDMTIETIAGLAANPNIYGTIAISLGCEDAQITKVMAEINRRTNKPLKSLVIQNEGGTIKTIKKATELAKKMVEEANKQQRVEVPVSELIFGTNCGGSDTTSGLVSNPLVGQVSDYLVEQKATTVICETTEFIGAEHILAKRASNEETRDKIYNIVKTYEDNIRQMTGKDVREGNPSPGNIHGGLTTLEEKSLGCIHKGGTSPINKIYDYAQPMETGQGLVIMDTPSNDSASVTGLIAGGAQIVVFTTGRGTPTGNPIAPVVKVTANRETYEKMSDNIDFDASGVLFDEVSMDELREKLIDRVIDYCNGEETKAEELGFTELAIQRTAVFV